MPYMLTSQDSDQNLAEIVANGIYTHFANVRVELIESVRNDFVL